jgi:pimeloyl-ACP methyl ester carboxylesterase
MGLDVELYRRTIYAHVGRSAQKLCPISVIDIHPEEVTRTLVLVHEFGGSATQWLYQLKLFGQTMRVVAPDLRGHGLSDDPEGLAYTMDGLVNDLETVLDSLDVQRPFYLIAHSFGGAISTEYALRHPENVSGLVLIGVPTRFILRAIVERLMLIPDPLFSWIAHVIKVALFAPQRTLKRMSDRIQTTWRGDERMQQLQVPTLVVMGHRDTVFLREHYEDVPRKIPGAQQVVILPRLLRLLKRLWCSNEVRRLPLKNSLRPVVSGLTPTKYHARSSFARSYLKISWARYSGACW